MTKLFQEGLDGLWSWAGSCKGIGYTGVLTLDIERHRISGSLRRQTKDRKTELIWIRPLGFNHGTVREIDTGKMPPPPPIKRL